MLSNVICAQNWQKLNAETQLVNDQVFSSNSAHIYDYMISEICARNERIIVTVKLCIHLKW